MMARFTPVQVKPEIISINDQAAHVASLAGQSKSDCRDVSSYGDEPTCRRDVRSIDRLLFVSPHFPVNRLPGFSALVYTR